MKPEKKEGRKKERKKETKKENGKKEKAEKIAVPSFKEIFPSLFLLSFVLFCFLELKTTTEEEEEVMIYEYTL